MTDPTQKEFKPYTEQEISAASAELMERLEREDMDALDEVKGGASLNFKLENDASAGDGGSTPEQYGLPPGATELQDLIEHRNMNFAVGNIFKACYRTGNCKHSDHKRDMRKVIWFASRELARISD